MNFTINEVDEVIDRTGCSYQEAKDALTKANGDVVDAVILIEKAEDPVNRFNEFVDETGRTAESIVAKIKEIIAEGDASRFEIINGEGKKIASVSLTSGIVAGGLAVMLGAAPIVIISSLIAKFGLNYQYVIVRKDGSTITF